MSSSYKELIDKIDPRKLQSDEETLLARTASEEAELHIDSSSLPVERPPVAGKVESTPSMIEKVEIAPKRVSTFSRGVNASDFQAIFKATLLLDQKYKLGALFRRNNYFRKQDSPTLRLALQMFAVGYASDRGTLSRILRDLGVVDEEGLLSISGKGSGAEVRLLDFLKALLPEKELSFEVFKEGKDKVVLGESAYAEWILDEVLDSFSDFAKSPPVEVAHLYNTAEKAWLYYIRELSDLRLSISERMLKLTQFYKEKNKDKATYKFEINSAVKIATDGDISKLDGQLSDLGAETFEESLLEVVNSKKIDGIKMDRLNKGGIAIERKIQADDISTQIGLKSRKEYSERCTAAMVRGEVKLLMLGGFFKSYTDDALGNILETVNDLDWEVNSEILPILIAQLRTLDKNVEQLASLIMVESNPLILLATVGELEMVNELKDTLSQVSFEGKTRQYSLLCSMLGEAVTRSLLDWIEILPLMAVGSSKDGDRLFGIGSLLDIKLEQEFLSLTSRVRNSDILRIYQDSILSEGRENMTPEKLLSNSIISDLIPENYYLLRIVTCDSDLTINSSQAIAI